MEHFIGCDAHKKFSVFATINEKGEYGESVRVSHELELFREYLGRLPAGSAIALETSGSYYWLVDEMSRGGHEPHLAHALPAKRRMEGRHKTDERDARGLAMLLRNGTLPRVWIPPAKLRDEREILRLRMKLVRARTQIKNRIHGILMRYNIRLEHSDAYGRGGRQELAQRCGELPEWTRASVRVHLEMLDYLQMQLEDVEQLLEHLLAASVERDILRSWPGVGKVLSAVLALEIGQVERFSSAERLASYCGLAPVARESAARKRKGQCPDDRNVYLNWAYVEAANVIVTHRKEGADKHVERLYQRVLSTSKMHAKAAVAVGRHLAEASWWMLSKQQIYQEPKAKREAGSSMPG